MLAGETDHTGEADHPTVQMPEINQELIQSCVSVKVNCKDPRICSILKSTIGLADGYPLRESKDDPHRKFWIELGESGELPLALWEHPPGVRYYTYLLLKAIAEEKWQGQGVAVLVETEDGFELKDVYMTNQHAAQGEPFAAWRLNPKQKVYVVLAIWTGMAIITCYELIVDRKGRQVIQKEHIDTVNQRVPEKLEKFRPGIIAALHVAKSSQNAIELQMIHRRYEEVGEETAVLQETVAKPLDPIAFEERPKSVLTAGGRMCRKQECGLTEDVHDDVACPEPDFPPFPEE